MPAKQKKRTKKIAHEARYERLNAWVQEALRVLLLSETFQIEVSESPPPTEGSLAEIEVTDHGGGTLYVEASFFFESSDRQLRTMAHELCHLYFTQSQFYVDHLNKDRVVDKLYVEIVVEPTVERLSRVLHKLLPPLPKLC